MTDVLTFAVTLCLLTASSQPPQDASATELKRHQGTWVVTSFVRDGMATPANVARTIVREVQGDHVVWKREGKSFAGTTIVLDATKDPHAIDVIPDGGRTRGKHVLGIYKLEGETLTLCMADPDLPRPTAFDAAAGSRLTLMTFKRLADPPHQSLSR